MVLAALLVLITVAVGIFFQPPMWVVGCFVIATLLAMFLGD